MILAAPGICHVWGRRRRLPRDASSFPRRGHRPRRGEQGESPLSWKTAEGGAGGIAAQAKTDPPLKEGAGQNQNPLPPSRVQGAQPPPGEQGDSPCSQKRRRVGWWDNGAGQASPPAEGGRRPSQNHPSPSAGGRRSLGLLPHPLAKYERLCYSTPMKSATGPLLFLGACRITYGLGANHGKSPRGRGAEGTPRGARPSEEGWGRSECRCRAQALGSR